MSDYGPTNELFVIKSQELEKEVLRRRGLEKSLKQTEAFYVYLVENAHDIIYKIDLQ